MEEAPDINKLEPVWWYEVTMEDEVAIEDVVAVVWVNVKVDAVIKASKLIIEGVERYIMYRWQAFYNYKQLRSYSTQCWFGQVKFAIYLIKLTLTSSCYYKIM